MNLIEKNNKRQEVLSKIKKIIVDRLNLSIAEDFIDDDSPLFGNGLGLDSIDSLELVVGLEDEFGIKIEEGNYQIFLSVNTIADYILGSLNKCETKEIVENVEDTWLSSYKALRENILMFSTDAKICEIENTEESLGFVSKIVSGNDIVLEPNRALYTSILNDDGKIQCFVYVMMFEDKIWFVFQDDYTLGVEFLEKESVKLNISVKKIESMKQLVFEGPYSWEVAKLIAGYEVLGLNYLHFMDVFFADMNITIFRAGIANEYGYRIFISEENELKLKDALSDIMEEKKIYEEKDCNNIEKTYELATREVRFPCKSSIFGKNNSLIQNDFKWMLCMQKDDFVGKKAVELENSKNTMKVIAFIIKNVDKALKVGSNLESELFFDEKVIGYIDTIFYSPSIQRYAGYAVVNNDYSYVDSEYYFKDGGSRIELTTVSTPLFLTKSTTIQME